MWYMILSLSDIQSRQEPGQEVGEEPRGRTGRHGAEQPRACCSLWGAMSLQMAGLEAHTPRMHCKLQNCALMATWVTDRTAVVRSTQAEGPRPEVPRATVLQSSVSPGAPPWLQQSGHGRHEGIGVGMLEWPLLTEGRAGPGTSCADTQAT